MPLFHLSCASLEHPHYGGSPFVPNLPWGFKLPGRRDGVSEDQVLNTYKRVRFVLVMVFHECFGPFSGRRRFDVKLKVLCDRGVFRIDISTILSTGLSVLRGRGVWEGGPVLFLGR